MSGPGERDGLTRRRVLRLALAVPPVAVLLGGRGLLDAADALAVPLAATPAIVDDDEPTPEQTEGPYFTPASPLRRSIVPAGAAGTRLTVSGRVLTTAGRPIPGALLDFWQCDAAGVYDNEGYRFRGHQLADGKGRYALRTVVPGLYPGRTRHIHVKVQPPAGAVLTTQLYVPGEPRNRTDGIFDPALRVEGWRRVNGRRLARFDFVLDT